MPQDTPSRHLDQFVVRLPPGLRERIAAQAKENHRSMNAEIVWAIEVALEDQKAVKLFESHAELKALVEKLNDLTNQLSPIPDEVGMNLVRADDEPPDDE